MAPRIPDFFIVGAPKCGTTALYSYLRQHPDVFMPNLKEVQFFCSDLAVPSMVANEQAYLSLFSDAKNEKRVGEASVWYLYSTRAAQAMHFFNPESSIIIMLRDPVEMLYALHSQRIFNGVQSVIDFERALNGEIHNDVMTNVLTVPDPLSGPFSLDVGRYTKHVMRYFDVFGVDRVKIILYDDFVRNPSDVYVDVLRFLDVRTDFTPRFEVINANRHVRNVLLQRMVRTPSAPLRAIVRALLPRPLRQRAVETIALLNSRRAPRGQMSDDLRRKLTRQLVPDVMDLSKLIGRDLTHWLCH
jgi:Sulfotransferase domain